MCVRGAACGEPFLKPSSCSHFLGLMDAAAAQWQRARMRVPEVNSAPARPGCRTWGCQRAATGILAQGWAHGDSRRQDTLPASAGSELDRALSPVKCSRLYYARFLPCFTTVSEPEAEMCWLFFFFPACLSRTACFVMFYVISAPSPVSAICCSMEFSTAVCLLKGKNTDQLDTL